jgi:NIPSNAP protein
MIYLKETLNLAPASPETRDAYIEFAQADLLPTYERLGARLVGAWFSHVEWYGQITQVLEFDDLSAFQAFRTGAGTDARWQECECRVEQFAPQRSGQLLEPLGPIPPSTLHDAVRASRETPLTAYTFAVLEVAPGKMARFVTTLEAVREVFPIIATWRAVAGNPNEVIDLWKGALGQEPYAAADERSKAFFGPLREMVPRERLVNLYSLPHSPLR